MSYNIDQLPRYINTAGKITVITAILGVAVFMIVFLLNIGAKELTKVEAQSGLATTSVTVLNTPPQWTIDAQESIESSTTTPTNSGDTVTWIATATDSNAEDYYLLICNGSTAPTANVAAAPDCGGADIQWAVSALTNSGVQASAATTTTEVAPFAEENDWYAWVCDAVAVNPRCNSAFRQGTATTASPFNVNKRPTFTAYSDNSPADPGALVVFTATADDPDVDPVDDTVRLWVCSTASFNSTSTIGCNHLTLASSSLAVTNPTANYTIPVPMPDTTYAAYGFVVDNHGHVAAGGSQGTDAILTVNNVAPTVPAGQISLNNGSDITLVQNAGETTGFTLQYVAQDDNSCEDSVGGDEISGYLVSVYRSGIGSTTCDGTTPGSYDANNCYTTGVATSTWNISCTASSTSCTYGVDGIDDEQIWDCTFPLWYVADPTEGTSTVTFYHTEDWRAAISAIDDDGATTTNHTQSSLGRELISLLYMALDTLTIPYGALEPGQYTPTATSTTIVRSEGNVGIDERLAGESMCGSYTSATPCPTSPSATIPESEQIFATSTVSYGVASSSGNFLSSTTPKFLDLNVKKPTSTASSTSGTTYWGIRVPASITTAGNYTGENTFYVVRSDPSQWY